MGFGFTFGIMPYGSELRAQRRVFHQEFQQSVVHKYRPRQLQQIRAFLPWVLDSPVHTRKYVRQ